MRFIVISYYTKDRIYQEEIKKLIVSLKKFNLNYDIDGIDSLGNWQRNTYYKAVFIKRKLIQHKDKNILWLDADVILRSYPVLFNDMKADLAVHYIDWRKYRRQSRKELNTSVMYFSNNEKIKKLLDLWIAENKRKIDSGIWEQKNLQNILISYKDLNIYHLPASYCQIYDLMRMAGKPVIELFQASRKLRYQRRRQQHTGRKFISTHDLRHMTRR